MPSDGVLVVGGTGLLGQSLLRTLGGRGIGTWHRSPPPADGRWQHLELGDAAAIETLLTELAPAVIINAAYARGGPDLHTVTARAPALLARGASEAGVPFVHLSTDVVFAGDRAEPYLESDPPAPVHDYGRAKAAAETSVAEVAPHALIVRTSLLYGHEGGPQERLVGQGGAGQATFFTDEVRAPAHVDDLARAIVDAIERGVVGIVHLAGADAVDRLEFARLLAPTLGVDPDRLRGRASDPEVIRPRHVVLRTERADVALLPGCRTRLSSTGPPSGTD